MVAARTITTTPAEDNYPRLVQGDAPFMLVQALRLCTQNNRANDGDLWTTVRQALGRFFAGDAHGRPKPWTQDAAAQVAESGFLDATVLNVLRHLGEVDVRGEVAVFTVWRRSKQEGRARVLADEQHYGTASFLGTVACCDYIYIYISTCGG